MDNKSKILSAVLVVLIVGAIVATYNRIFIQLDYPIKAEISCDPEIENCFIYECNPDEDESCSQNPEERVSYYKIIEKKAANIPLCDPNNEDCPELTCAPGEKDCQITLCTPDNTDGVPCSGDQNEIDNITN